MEPERDFKELLERFNASGIEYLIVGGYAGGCFIGWRTRSGGHSAERFQSLPE